MKPGFFVFLFSFFASLGQAQISPPSQAVSGPGSNAYPHGSVRISNRDDGTTGFWVLEPASPAPDSANVVVFFHGFGAVNPKLYGAWMEHLCRKGNIVIWPRYQINEQSPGAQYNQDAATAILRAMDSLELVPGHVLPRRNQLAYVGHSVGGVLSANLGMVGHTQFNLPQAKAVFSCQPGANADIKFSTYREMEAGTKMLIVAGDGDFLVGDADAKLIWDSTVNVSTLDKNYVIHYADNHGSPALTAGHEDPLAIDNDYDNGVNSFFVISSTLAAKTDAVDYYCFWKLSEALLNCAFSNMNCEYALGDTPQQKFMGEWSDNQAAVPLVVLPSLTSVSPIQKNSAFISAWPNPITQGEVRVQIPGELNGNMEFFLQDLSGKSMRVSETHYTGDNTILLQLEAPAGIYILRGKSSGILYSSLLSVQ